MSPMNNVIRHEGLYRQAQSDARPILRRRTRRLLITGIAAGTLATGTAAVVLPDQSGIYPAMLWLIVAVSIGQWLGRRGTRYLALAPLHLLDERQAQQVHSAYHHAYAIGAVATGTGMATAALGVLLGEDRSWIGLGALYVLFLLMLQLPNMVLAWRLDDEEPEEPPTQDASARVVRADTEAGGRPA